MINASAPLLKVVGKAMMLGAQQFAIGSVLIVPASGVGRDDEGQETSQRQNLFLHTRTPDILFLVKLL